MEIIDDDEQVKRNSNEEVDEIEEERPPEDNGDLLIDDIEVERKERVINSIELLFALIEIMIAVRISFQFLGLDVSNVYARLFYSATDFMVKPFLDVFSFLTFESNSSVLEGGSIVLVLALIASQRFVVYLIKRK